MVERLAGSFRNSPQYSRLVRTSWNHRSSIPRRQNASDRRIPIDFCMSTARQLGIGSIVTQGLSQAEDFLSEASCTGLAAQIAQATDTMGMRLMYPPDVADGDWYRRGFNRHNG
ncbi:MAG: hypothetical protein R2688_08685 [Fimbriimonadaceae bacterium]